MNRRKSTRSASEHTVVITDVQNMFWKLAWDIKQFDEIQRNQPDFVAPLAYAAINVCIAATSLRDWVVSEVRSLRRDQGLADMREQAIREQIYRYVPQQQMCEAIANTAKHSRLSEGDWQGGSVRVNFHEPDEWTPGGYMLMHIHGNQRHEIGLNEFMALERCWWLALHQLGFAFQHSGPDWWQARLRSIFGDRAATGILTADPQLSPDRSEAATDDLV